MKIETHSGLIVTAHMLGKKPIAFHDRDQLYPTVYLLWLLPPEKLLIPYFTTWHEVLPKVSVIYFSSYLILIYNIENSIYSSSWLMVLTLCFLA